MIKAKAIFIYAILFVACAINASAAVEVRALIQLSSTSVTNLNGTNAASITVDSDTRIWTNSVTSASTQIQATTNLSTAVSRLLNHLRTGQYPFTGLTAYGTNNGIVLLGSAAFDVVISNSWATVTYATNTLGTLYSLRGPRDNQPSPEKEVTDDRVVEGVNNAATNTVSAGAAAMVNFVDTSENQTVAGDKTFTGTGNTYAGASMTLSGFANVGTYLQLAHSALTAHSAVTNFVADFTGVAYRSITAAADINFVHSTNRAAVRNVVVFLYPGGANRNLSVNASWHPVGSAVNAVLTNNTIGILSITCATGTTETNVFYSYAVAQ